MNELLDLKEVQAAIYLKAIDEGRNIIFLISDSLSTSKVQPIQKKYPERVVNVGIAEMNVVGVAAGLAKVGFIPVVGTAAAFLTSRANEQLKIDISYSRANVKVNAMHPGFFYGNDGVTHHAVNDISVILGFPSFEVYCPCDGRETKQILEYGIDHVGPVYTSLGSGEFETITDENHIFVPGCPLQFQEGADVTIIALGTAVHDVLAAKIPHADVFAVTSLRPLDERPLVESIKKTGKVVVVEMHQTHGGLGSLVSEIVTDHGLGARVKRLGVPNSQFTLNTNVGANKQYFCINMEGIQDAVKGLLA